MYHLFYFKAKEDKRLMLILNIINFVPLCLKKAINFCQLSTKLFIELQKKEYLRINFAQFQSSKSMVYCLKNICKQIEFFSTRYIDMITKKTNFFPAAKLYSLVEMGR